MFNFETLSNGYGGAGTINGVMIASVTDNKDPENMGRVKLKFPLRESEHQTDWAPVASLMSGNAMGTLFIPEVGDEVLVAFHLGHLNQPFVIGCLWNQKNKPPAKEDKNNIRKIRSKKGHELIFDDTDNAGKVTLKTVKGIQLVIEDQPEKIAISTKNDQQTVSLAGGSSGTITIQSGTNKITIDNKGDIQIQSTKAVTIKSTQLNLEATASMKINAGAQLDIQSSGILNLKGSMVKIN